MLAHLFILVCVYNFVHVLVCVHVRVYATNKCSCVCMYLYLASSLHPCPRHSCLQAQLLKTVILVCLPFRLQPI